MIYVVIEWCLQSHLSTEKYEAALRGLRRTRNFRRVTYPYRRIIDIIIRKFWTRRSVVWTYEVTYKPEEGMPGRRDRLMSIPQISVTDENLAQVTSSESVAISVPDGIHLQTMRGRGDSFSSSGSAPSALSYMGHNASDVELLHEERA